MPEKCHKEMHHNGSQKTRFWIPLQPSALSPPDVDTTTALSPPNVDLLVHKMCLYKRTQIKKQRIHKNQISRLARQDTKGEQWILEVFGWQGSAAVFTFSHHCTIILTLQAFYIKGLHI
jgi:hypothetical protein